MAAVVQPSFRQDTVDIALVYGSIVILIWYDLPERSFNHGIVGQESDSRFTSASVLRHRSNLWHVRCPGNSTLLHAAYRGAGRHTEPDNCLCSKLGARYERRSSYNAHSRDMCGDGRVLGYSAIEMITLLPYRRCCVVCLGV